MKLKRNENKISTNCALLILLCFAVYFIAYLGRYSYSSNINCIIDFFGVNKPSAGIVGTFFFIAYGIGQVVNGLLCKKYNPRYAIFLALIVSALTNVAFALAGKEHFEFLKYFWFINGFAQSVLWSSIIRLLNEHLPRSGLGMAIFVMALPVSFGTFVIYGLSALISAFAISFKAVFVIATVLLAIIAFVWFFAVDKLKLKCLAEKQGETMMEEEVKTATNSQNGLDKRFVFTFSVLAIFAIVNNLVKDGLTTWMPVLLKEKYALTNSLSTFLTLFLPLFAVGGSTFAIFLNKKMKNYILSCGVLYLAAFALFLGVIFTINLPLWIFPLICFILVACSMSGVNNLITNIFPMLYSHKINSGTLAGVLDGFCYVGSAITAYGLGAISDRADWNAVFYLFLGVCLLMILLCAVYTLITARVDKKAKLND